MLGKIHTSVIHPSVSIHPTATISGPVILEANVRVMEYAKLVGPLYVGAGTIIGNHTLIRASHIGENSVIGFSSDVTRSYIGNNSWFHSNYVGDSIVADDVGMGAGATLANLRLDEGEVYSTVKGQRIPTERNKLGTMIGNGVRIGVGTYLMPGVKVGQNSVVGAGCVLQSDLAENKLCFSKQTHQITENVMSNARNRDRFRQKI
jgi:bifunctional UDP-N-acetylglucosamine pyrophosphorylase/glucosamine-1-phosphate N-acetyltransferase